MPFLHIFDDDFVQKTTKIHNESDRFFRFNPTDLAQIAKVYGITARIAPSELVWKAPDNSIKSEGRRKGWIAERPESAERRRKDFLGQFGQKIGARRGGSTGG